MQGYRTYGTYKSYEFYVSRPGMSPDRLKT